MTTCHCSLASNHRRKRGISDECSAITLVIAIHHNRKRNVRRKVLQDGNLNEADTPNELGDDAHTKVSYKSIRSVSVCMCDCTG